LKISKFKFAAAVRRRSAICSLNLVIGCVVAASAAHAQGNSSLSESKKSGDTEVSASALLSQNEELRRQLSLQQESVRTLTDSLAQSNAEAEEFRRKFSDLQLRMEALGLASADQDRAKLEQRLLNAVSDLKLFEKEREQYRDQMLRLTESVLRFLKTAESSDAQARMDVEAQLRSINELIARAGGEGMEALPNLLDGSVISVKQEWSLVVGNIGEQQGVKVGMPLRVMRNDRVIATLRVVDVRQKICGAVIQEMDSKKEQIRVGDRLQVDARRDVSLK
jgi:hypothetical protein